MKNVELYDYFKDLGEEVWSDVGQLTKAVQKVGYKLNRKKLVIEEDKCDDIVWGGCRVMQYPNELAQYLHFFYTYRHHINNYYEIGVHKGGTFFVVDSFLRAVNPKFRGSLGIDIKNSIAEFEPYKEKYKTVDFQVQNSKQFAPPKNFDFIFIDGDHSYVGVLADYNMVMPFAKFIGFHDIFLQHAEVSKLWFQIKPNYFSREILNRDTRFKTPVGLGIIDNRE